MAKKFWKTSEIKFIRENIKLTDKEIAAHLGRTELAVLEQRRKYKISKYPKEKPVKVKPEPKLEKWAKPTYRNRRSYFDEQEREKLMMQYERGYSSKTLAGIYNCTQRTVQLAIRRYKDQVKNVA